MCKKRGKIMIRVTDSERRQDQGMEVPGYALDKRRQI